MDKDGGGLASLGGLGGKDDLYAMMGMKKFSILEKEDKEKEARVRADRAASRGVELSIVESSPTSVRLSLRIVDKKQ